MANDKLGIAQRAAFNSGNGTIATLDDGSDASLAIEQHYEAIVTDMITSGSPNWAQRTRALTQLSLPAAEAAVLPWKAIYAAPVDMLALKYVQDSCAQRIDHEEVNTSMGRGIAVMCAPTTTSIYAVHVYRAPEAVWPADFAMTVQMKLEAILLKGFAEQRQEANIIDKGAAYKEQRVRVRDRSASTGADPSEWDLTRARGSSRRWNQYSVR